MRNRPKCRRASAGRCSFVSIASALLLALPLASPSPALADEGYQNPYTGTVWNNAASSQIDTFLLLNMQAQLLRTQLMSNLAIGEMVRDAARLAPVRERGAARIRDGVTSNLIPALRRDLAAELLRPGLPEAEREETLRAVTAALEAFEGEATTRGARLDDAGDVLALSLAMGYEVWQGRPGLLTRGQLDGMRAASARVLREDALFQGHDDAARRALAAAWATSAGEAWAKHARAATFSDAELLKESREAARRVVAALWPDPPEAIEPTQSGLVDRGCHRIAQGRATVTFTPRPEPTMPAELAAQDYDRELRWRKPFDVEEPVWRERMLREREAYHRDCLSAFVGRLSARELPTNDIAIAGAEAVAVVWPLCEDGAVPLTPAQVAATARLFREDILGDPALQRMDNDGFRRFFEYVATTAEDLRREDERLRARLAEQEKELATLTGDDKAYLRAAARAAIEATRSGRNVVRARANTLVRQMFHPRDVGKLKWTDAGPAFEP